MARPKYIDREEFKKHFNNALIKCNISKSNRDKFLTNTSSCTLRNIGICAAITNVIDNYMTNVIEGYDGCLSIETFDTIYEWNKKCIYEYTKKKE